MISQTTPYRDRRFLRTLLCRVFVLLAGCGIPLSAQSVEHIRFDHITVEDGLSQGVIEVMLHDQRGFMWFGTGDGLNRYDGYTFTEFRNERGNPFSLSDNAISALAQDEDGWIWIGTAGGGLNAYNPAAHSMQRFPAALPVGLRPGSRIITALCFDGSGVLWIGTDGEGLVAYNPADSSIEHYYHEANNPHALSTNEIHSIVRADSTHLWIAGTGSILHLLDTKTGKVRRYACSGAEGSFPYGSSIVSLARETDDVVWAATATSGVFRLDRRSGLVRRFQPPGSVNQNMMGPIRTLMLDSQRRLWFGTEVHGIYVYHLQTKTLEHIRPSPLSLSGLSFTGIRSLFEDRIGNIWVGTNGNGLHFASPAMKAFRVLRNRFDDPGSITVRSFRTVYQDRDSVLWIGGYGGLNIVNRATGEIYVFPEARETVPRGRMLNGLSNTNIHALHPDPVNPERYLLAGTEGDGLYRIDTKTLLVERLPVGSGNDPSKLRGYTVHDLLTDREGLVWIGTELGLSSYDMQSRRFTHYIHDPEDPGSLNAGAVRCLFEDRNGFLWIGSDRGGLGLFDRVSGDFSRFEHDPDDVGTLSSNRVYSILEDHRGMLWVGTSLGLNRMDRQSTTFRNYDRSDGFPNDVIYGILEDAAGYLWISTNKGLVRFHSYRGVVSTFDESDGLQGNEFNSAAFFQTASGEMFFGGVNGLTYFTPSSIRRNPYVPPVLITECTVGGRRVIPFPNADGDLALEIAYTREAIVFEYAALSFFRAEKNLYRYRLEGVHQNWSKADRNRQLTFVALSPGDYRLHVRGSNNDGVWNAEGVTLVLTVLPPFWATWWFRLIIVLILASAALMVFRWRLAIARRQEVQLALTVEERTAELRHSNASLLQEIEERKRAEEEAYRANATKSEFLAHLSHEIRTPMNAILGYTEILSDKIVDDTLRSHLRSIELSGNNLLRLINDILDLSKIEAGRIELELVEVDLRGLLREIEHVFEFQFRRKDLQFVLRYDDRIPRTLYLDALRTRQILFNLVGNAVKYTEEGTITVEAALASRHKDVCTLSIAVRDTGVGIPPTQQEIVFEPFRQVGSSRTVDARGTGLGLAITKRLLDIMGGSIHLESKLGQGSVFRITLPEVRFSMREMEADTGRASTDPWTDADDLGTAAYAHDVEAEPEHLTAERVVILRALLAQMQQDFDPQWRAVSRHYHIQEMEEFARNVRDAAVTGDYPPLVTWSERLVEEAGNFDMENIPRTLKQFPVILQKLQERCHDA